MAPSNNSREPASPACSAHEADDAYMGFASRREIEAFLQALAAAERAGWATAEMLRKMLPRVRDERLHRRLSIKLREQESKESRT